MYIVSTAGYLGPEVWRSISGSVVRVQERPVDYETQQEHPLSCCRISGVSLLTCLCFQGLPGVDGREGIPGMPGAKVGPPQHLTGPLPTPSFPPPSLSDQGFAGNEGSPKFGLDFTL